MTITQSRIVGSGFTSIFFNGKSIALLDTFRDSGQRPVTQPEEVHVLGGPHHPSEIATTKVVGAGTLTITLREAWDSWAWQHLLDLAGAIGSDAMTIAEAQEALENIAGELTMTMVIKGPKGKGNRGKTYHGMVMSDLGDGNETVGVGTLTIPRSPTFMYTHVTPYKS